MGNFIKNTGYMIKAFRYFIILFILFFHLAINAQYSSNERDLVKTTFDRIFDTNIISTYLSSSDPLKVNAALLSIAQNGNKSFIESIENLNFSQNPEYICFALGQLGPDSSSSDFLYQKLSDPNLPVSYKQYILKAVGKTGYPEILERLANDYLSNNYLMFDGISTAIYDFYSRGIKDDQNCIKILQNELTAADVPIHRKIDAAFAIYRTNLSNYFKDIITDEISNYDNEDVLNTERSTLTQYLLENLRRSKYFPDNTSLFGNLVNSNIPLIRIEAAKVLVYYKYQNSDDLLEYLSLLNDDNPNVSRQAAISIKDISIPEPLAPELKSRILKIINAQGGPANTKGELFISYISLFPEPLSQILNTFNNKVGNEYLLRAASMYASSDSALNYLVNNYKNGTAVNKISILGYLANFQNSFGNNSNLNDIFFKALTSDSPALISIASDEIDSAFVDNNRDDLINTIAQQTLKYLNNPDYIESLLSLNGLAQRLDKNAYSQNLEDLSNSNIYSIRAFAKNKLDLPVEKSLDTDTLFDNIWRDSFKYKYAQIETEKGTFTINLLPEYAPVTVGNFCYLAEKKFFDNLIFHRVVPGFVIQTGDPTGSGWGGPGYEIVSEFSPLHYSTGTVGMASSGKDTEGSQWFVTTGDYPHLDRRYTIFGFVSDGMNVVNYIDQNDKIVTVKLTY
jgi:cyclophilin family peptidyl-prolyl cis-trans isomerase/HEAT repeat protein